MTFKKLPSLEKKRILVKPTAKVTNVSIKGQFFEVEEVTWSSKDIDHRKPIVKVAHPPFDGKKYSWVSIEDIEVYGGLEACL